MIEPHHEVRVGTTSVLRLVDDGTDCRKHVLDAVVELRIQCALMFFCSFACTDIASNLGGPDNYTRDIAQRRNCQRNVNQSSILATSDSFVVAHVFTQPNALQDRPFLVLAIWRDQNQDRFANNFLGPIAKYAFRALVPALDDAVEVFTYDGVIGRFDNGYEPLSAILGFLALSDVAGDAKQFCGNSLGVTQYRALNGDPAGFAVVRVVCGGITRYSAFQLAVPCAFAKASSMRARSSGWTKRLDSLMVVGGTLCP